MQHSGNWPPVLYLQMDNCGSENKNVYTLGFLSQLIYLGYFHEIELSFLPAGHTHEDIDQCFSIFHKQLHDWNVYSPVDCHGFLESCYSSLSHKPDSSLANFSWEVVDTHGSFHDWKSFLTPHMVEVSQHSQPHHFHFTYSHQSMAVELHVQDWPTSEVRPDAPVYIVLPKPIVGLPPALPSVPLDPKFASDFGPSMRSKLLVAHVHSLEATFQAYATPVQGTPLAMSDLLCPLDFLCQVACSSAAPALNNVLLVLGRLCNQSPWSLEVGTVVAVLPEKPTLHENFWLASVLSFTHPNVTVHWFAYNHDRKTYSLMLHDDGDVHATAVVPYDSIVLHSIELTPHAQLPHITKWILLQACLLHQQSAHASTHP